ncbi:Aste57867_269 [Aphanomyces stellatus]|uniref:Aste57867_269 protein n=1 Tax=Aphanomyces stellatus TaxID=120398 RepID=A0A485K2D8_9STRA|nr:hypothetical protein As57867_000269 [Aphanomyces stellatus]VFT77495.1 Aste57867_269 [Aphanomyces stellatus]
MTRTCDAPRPPDLHSLSLFNCLDATLFDLPTSCTMSSICFFNDCDNPIVPGSWKCEFHKNRSRCLVDACQNQVYARNLCVRHGGKRRCEANGCDRNVRIGTFCSTHGIGAAKKLCTEDGCTNVAHKRHKCVRHGGGRKCRADGCPTHARSGGYCCRHTRLVGLVHHDRKDMLENIADDDDLCFVFDSAWTPSTPTMPEWKLTDFFDLTLLGRSSDSDPTTANSHFLQDMIDLSSILVDDALADFADDVAEVTSSCEKGVLDHTFPPSVDSDGIILMHL